MRASSLQVQLAQAHLVLFQAAAPASEALIARSRSFVRFSARMAKDGACQTHLQRQKSAASCSVVGHRADAAS